MELVRRLARLVRNSTSTVFFGGAGVSTASGIPDFRSTKGIYTNNISVERVLTPGFLQTQPKKFFEFNRKYFSTKGIKPNACHRVLALMESEGLLDMVITQNIDNLHYEAGSENVVELHGNSTRHYCMSCKSTYTEENLDQMGEIPRCIHCGGVVRPDIVLYEEGLNPRVVEQAIEGIKYSDLLIIGGTSLMVYPAAGLIDYQKHAGKKVLINLEETFKDDKVDLVIRESIVDVFLELAAYLELQLEE